VDANPVDSPAGVLLDDIFRFDVMDVWQETREENGQRERKLLMELTGYPG
jgi:hypothetical protein